MLRTENASLKEQNKHLLIQMKVVEWYGKLVDTGMDAESLLNRVEKAEKLNEKYR